jgi:hypothetical protein
MGLAVVGGGQDGDSFEAVPVHRPNGPSGRGGPLPRL